jgi:hypothetical protein
MFHTTQEFIHIHHYGTEGKVASRARGTFHRAEHSVLVTAKASGVSKADIANRSTFVLALFLSMRCAMHHASDDDSSDEK